MRVQAAALHCPWISRVHQWFKETKNIPNCLFKDHSAGNNLNTKYLRYGRKVAKTSHIDASAQEQQLYLYTDIIDENYILQKQH